MFGTHKIVKIVENWEEKEKNQHKGFRRNHVSIPCLVMKMPGSVSGQDGHTQCVLLQPEVPDNVIRQEKEAKRHKEKRNKSSLFKDNRDVDI